MLVRVLSLMVFSIAIVGDSAVADHYRAGHRSVVEPLGPEAMGCVWYRQRLDCSRYCYIEVNGKRYCRERAREAHPQGLFDEFVYVGPPMKVGRGAPRR